MERQAGSGGAEGPAGDGRIRRTQRSRARMVKAYFDLIGEGVLQPTAQQVAERAGVGIRTVFRHFSEMDTLFAEVDALLREEIAPYLVEPSAGGTVAERALEVVRARATAFERFAPYMRATRLYRNRSAYLRRNFAAFVRRQRASLLDALPELADAPPAFVDALELATSFESWDRLRTDQRLGATRTRAALEQTVLALVTRLEA